jgi:hypothetical protein
MYGLSESGSHVLIETNPAPWTNNTHNIVHPCTEHCSHRTKHHETSLQDVHDEMNDHCCWQVSVAEDHHEKVLKYHSNRIV